MTPVVPILDRPSVTVLSLGAGVQSSALLLMCDREPERVGYRPDFAVFADTGDEPRRVYEWLDKLERAVSIPIVRASRGDLMRAALLRRVSRKTGKIYRSPSLPLYTRGVNGTSGLLHRQCTRDYKIVPIERAVRQRTTLAQRRTGVRMLIGISRDEAHRMKPLQTPWIESAWPLVDLRMRREDCARYVREAGLGQPPRSACAACPFHSDEEWLRLRSEDPDAFDRAARWESAFRAALVSDPPEKRALSDTADAFLHDTRVPIREVRFEADRQGDLFGNECEGMCGV